MAAHVMMPCSSTSACTGLKLTDSGLPIVKLPPKNSLQTNNSRQLQPGDRAVAAVCFEHM